MIGPLLIARESTKPKILRDPERALDLAFDSEEPIDVVGERGAYVVVAETRPIVAVCVERAAARNDRDFDRARARARLLRVGATSADDRKRCEKNRDPTCHDYLLEPSWFTASLRAKTMPRAPSAKQAQLRRRSLPQ